jgi:hypothetical protein
MKNYITIKLYYIVLTKGKSTMTTTRSKILAIFLVLILAISAIGITLFIYEPEEKEDEKEELLPEGVQCLERNYSFSYPKTVEDGDYLNIYVNEADLNSVHDQWPVLPVNTTTFELPFGTKIIGFETRLSSPMNISLSKPVSYGSCSTLTEESETIYKSSEMYPSDFISYHTGGGISHGEHKTFITVQINPVTLIPSENTALYVENVSFRILYKEPETPILDDVHKYDLLIVSPESFTRNLQDLIDHKNDNGIKTEMVTVEDIEEKSKGRDLQEKIKYYIKQEIEESGIDYVLLVGGIDGQSTRWTLPVRYSHVLIREGTQELIEPEFISDLYYADIYDSEGNFSSWDTNNNDIFAEYDGGVIDEMDLYPDVAVGRIPCRNSREVRIIVDKIIDYETKTKNSDWFKNLILVSGDHWADEDGVSEGVLIMEKAADIMNGFNPIELFATEDNTLLTRDIRKAFNQGAGFAYFCGHGGISSWGIHYPPDATGWAPALTRLGLITFYNNLYMNLLRNRDKLPVTLVGGCNNGQYDVSFFGMLKEGRIIVSPHCWAWHLTIQKKGGSIATIANTGLGTHAMGDYDNNGVNDYLEVYDGWLELKFLETYRDGGSTNVGRTQSEAISQYLHTFLGCGDEMDIKMVQQWQLFGDPTLKIGGY